MVLKHEKDTVFLGGGGGNKFGTCSQAFTVIFVATVISVLLTKRTPSHCQCNFHFCWSAARIKLNQTKEDIKNLTPYY